MVTIVATVTVQMLSNVLQKAVGVGGKSYRIGALDEPVSAGGTDLVSRS